jgi:hypothetical protein
MRTGPRDERMLAIYVCDVWQKNRFYPLGFELFEMSTEHFLAYDVACVVRHNKTLEMGNYRKAADEGNFFLRGFNYLLLLKKRSGPARS